MTQSAPQPIVCRPIRPPFGEAERAPEERTANPAYVLLLEFRLAMTFTAGISLATFWVAAALALYVILVVVALGVDSPGLKRQIPARALRAHCRELYAQFARQGVGLHRRSSLSIRMPAA
jgi:hypothetical protein